MERRKTESEFYREIVRRAQRVRERAAESLRESRVTRKKQVDLRGHTDVRRRFHRQD
jgi:hypothetical protein